MVSVCSKELLLVCFVECWIIKSSKEISDLASVVVELVRGMDVFMFIIA